jgi:hypothetical protein
VAPAIGLGFAEEDDAAVEAVAAEGVASLPREQPLAATMANANPTCRNANRIFLSPIYYLIVRALESSTSGYMDLDVISVTAGDTIGLLSFGLQSL